MNVSPGIFYWPKHQITGTNTGLYCFDFYFEFPYVCASFHSNSCLSITWTKTLTSRTRVICSRWSEALLSKTSMPYLLWRWTFGKKNCNHFLRQSFIKTAFQLGTSLAMEKQYLQAQGLPQPCGKESGVSQSHFIFCFLPATFAMNQ